MMKSSNQSSNWTNQIDQKHKPSNILLENGRVGWVKFDFECKHTDITWTFTSLEEQLTHEYDRNKTQTLEI